MSSKFSIPDLASMVDGQFRSLATRVEEIRDLDGDWTVFHLHVHALNEQVRCDLQNALSTLHSLDQLLAKQSEMLRRTRKTPS